MSRRNRAVCGFLRLTRKRRYRTAEAGARLLAHGAPPAPAPRRLAGRVTRERLGGVPVDLVAPPSAPRPGAVVYLHGGAFVSGIARQHWQLVELLAAATGRVVHVPHYGRAPVHDVDDARALLEALADRLAREGGVHLVGDSAGGNLALLWAQGRVGDPALRGVTVLAPWLDLSLLNPGMDAVEPHDPWLTRAGLRPVAAAWAAGHDLRDPAVSPLFGRWDAIAPTEVYVGTRDLCLPDCLLLADRPAVTVHVEHGSPHVYPLLPTPEGRRARQQIARRVAASLG